MASHSPLALRVLLLLLAAFSVLLALSVSLAHAQSEANTTATSSAENVTVTLPAAPNITIVERGEASVSAQLSGPTLSVNYVCFYAGGGPDLCPEASYTLYDSQGHVLWSSSYRVDPGSDCHVATCSYKLRVQLGQAPPRAVLQYTLEWSDGSSRSGSITLVNQEQQGDLAKYIDVIPYAVAVGLGAQYSLAATGIGVVVAVVVDYLLSVAGIAPFSPLLAFMMILAGIIAIIFSRS